MKKKFFFLKEYFLEGGKLSPFSYTWSWSRWRACGALEHRLHGDLGPMCVSTGAAVSAFALPYKGRD